MATIPQDRQIHARLHISRPDGQTWVDVSPHLVRAEVELGDVSSVGTGNSGVDSVVRRMTFTLMPERANIPTWPITAGRDASEVIGDATDVVAQTTDPGYVWYDYLLNTPHAMQGDGFAPGDKASAWNRFNDEYAPLLQSMREAILYVAVTDPGVAPQPSDWVTLFHGYLGDSIRTEGSSVTCECRDLAKRLQNTVIEENRDYGSESGTPAELVIQKILDDNLGAGVVQLYCPVSPGFMVTPYTLEAEQSTKTVWDAIQEVAAQIGWFLGYRWDATTQAYRLTLMEPPRDKGLHNPDFVLDWEWDFYVHTLDTTDKDVRNAIRVSYRDKNDGKRKHVTALNETSIAVYGRRFMGIGEADTSHIDTAAEAQAMGEAAASDLGDLSGARSIDMPILPTMDVFSGVVTRDPRISTDDEFTGVESVRHVLDFGGERFRTEVSGASRIIGGHQRWLDMETRPGSPALPTPPEAIGGGGITLPAPTVTTEGVKPIPGGIEVHVPAPPVHSVRWSETRVWVSEQDGFDPTGMKPWASGRMDTFTLGGMAGGIKVYVRAAYVDADGRVSAYSAQVEATTGSTGEEPDMTPPEPPTGLTSVPTLKAHVVLWDRHQGPPPLDRYELQSSSRQPGDNLVVNPYLEDDGGEEWVPSTSDAEIESFTGYTRITTSARTAGVRQTVPLVMGQKYLLSYYVRHVSGTPRYGGHVDGADFAIRVDGGPWVTGDINEATFITIPDDGQWHLIEQRFTATKTGAADIWLQPGRLLEETVVGDYRTDQGYGISLTSEWLDWATVSDELRSNVHMHGGLESGAEYRYRVRVWSRAGIDGEWSEPHEAGTPAKTSLSEDVVGRLLGTNIEPGSLPEDAFDDELIEARAKWDGAGEFVDELAVRAISPDEISQTVGQVYPNGIGQQSTIQQHANMIAQRVMAVDENGQPLKDEQGNPIQGQIVLSMQDGKSVILLGANQTITGKLLVTEDLTIESPDGHAFIGPLSNGSFGFSASDNAGNRSELTEGRLAFFRSGDSDPFYYIKHIEMGVADVDQPVTFAKAFANPPEVLVAIQALESYDPTVGGKQTWRAFPENITVNGFTPKAQLEAVGTSGGETADYTLSVEPYGPTIVTGSSSDATYPTRYSAPGTTYMEWDVEVDFYSSGSQDVIVTIDYRESGGSTWIQAARQLFGLRGSRTFSVSVPENQYEWRMTIDYYRTADWQTASATIKNWRWTANQVISQQGRVQWIAIER